MDTDPRVSELLLRWQELRQEGQTVTAAELCLECPELADELQRRIVTVDHWEQFLGTRDEEEAAHATSASFGKYRVVRPLGDGGQASTLLAFDPDLRCHVVLKLYHRASSPTEQETVLSEGQALTRVRSPYVVRCYGVERQDGVPALVMEYIPGRNLREQQSVRPLDIAQSLELTKQLAEGLAAVHACGLLHRDLKPENVLIGEDGRPRLVDFGLAAPVASADLARISGTLPYMAPEQARGESERIDARTDVFGLGAVLYELLTGRPPYEGASTEELYRAACAGDVVPPRQFNRRVSRDVNDLCQRCLAKDPTQRFASAAELSVALSQLQRRSWRRPRVWASLLVALVALLCGAALWQPWRVWFQSAPIAGNLDVFVSEPQNPARESLWLKDPGALPLRAGDEVRIVAKLNRPAYLYVLWLDASGKAVPLYPWIDGDWRRRREERPVADLKLPVKAGQAYRIDPGPPGLEVVLLLASDSPLPQDVGAANLSGVSSRER
jgi:serine/threonine protein kinase